jgi:hypothetical protein
MLWLALGFASGLACGCAVWLALPKYIRLLDNELLRVKAAYSRGDETEALQHIMETGWPPRVPLSLGRQVSDEIVREPAPHSAQVKMHQIRRSAAVSARRMSISPMAERACWALRRCNQPLLNLPNKDNI